jgi:hypothetical protein
MTLDLNMGYYHIELSPSSKCLCTIVMPFGKYEFQRLPMGLCNSPDIFQERMYEIFSDLEYVRVYIDDLLVTSYLTFEEHLQKLELVFSRLSEAGLKLTQTSLTLQCLRLNILDIGLLEMVSNQYIKKLKQFNALLLRLLRHKLDPFLDLSITIETCGLEDQKF